MQGSSLNPPGRIPVNKLTRGMELVDQYNAMYPARGMGGAAVPPCAVRGGGRLDLRAARRVVEVALEVISRAFAAQLGSLLQRYGLVVVPGTNAATAQAVPGAVQATAPANPVPPGPEGPGGPEAQVSEVP